MNKQPFHKGSALLMVLWAIAIMSICVLGLVQYLYHDLDETIAFKKQARAGQMARSGVAVALDPLVEKQDSALKQVFDDGAKFDVHLGSEGGRLNINAIMQNGRWAVLQNLFLRWGMHAADVVAVVKSMQKWTMPLQQTTAQNEAVQQSAQPLRRFRTVDEMLKVPGMNQVAAIKPEWRDYFTVWSDGGLDVNDAPAELIAAVCGIGQEQAQALTDTRLGPDGTEGTSDDKTFTDLEQVRLLLGMSKESFSAVAGMLSIKDSTARIESTGEVHGIRHQITVVVKRVPAPAAPIYYQWRES